MSKIVALLNDLEGARAALETVNAEVQTHIPAHLVQAQSDLEKRVKCIEAEVKDKAKFIPPSQAHTLVGNSLQLVWNEETPVSYVRKAFWSIKKRGGK